MKLYQVYYFFLLVIVSLQFSCAEKEEAPHPFVSGVIHSPSANTIYQLGDTIKIHASGVSSVIPFSSVDFYLRAPYADDYFPVYKFSVTSFEFDQEFGIVINNPNIPTGDYTIEMHAVNASEDWIVDRLIVRLEVRDPQVQTIIGG